jgi:hypothetical protein
VLGRASTGPTAGRDSLDDSDGVSSFGERGLMSMESLGQFDDGVSQMGTGYAVASSKRNAEFHAIFKSIPDDDYLIEGESRPAPRPRRTNADRLLLRLDYGCALQREILIQGRLYISEHHLSFNANIFGWVTTVSRDAAVFLVRELIPFSPGDSPFRRDRLYRETNDCLRDSQCHSGYDLAFSGECPFYCQCYNEQRN